MNAPQVRVLLADKLVDTAETQLAENGFEVLNQPQLTASDLERTLTDVDILVVRSTRVTADALDAAGRLSLIIRAGAGVNTIDVAKASDLGIQVANCPGKNAAAVAELTIGLLIAADRQIANARCGTSQDTSICFPQEKSSQSTRLSTGRSAFLPQ